MRAVCVCVFMYIYIYVHIYILREDREENVSPRFAHFLSRFSILLDLLPYKYILSYENTLFEFIALSISFLRKRSRTIIKITPNKMSIVRGINYYVFLKVSHRSKVDGQKFIIFH